MFFADLAAAVEESERETLAELWSLVWAGAVTNDAWQPLRSGAALRAVEPQRPGRPGRRAKPTASLPAARGRWSLVEGLLEPAAAPRERARALAETLLDRHGVVDAGGRPRRGHPRRLLGRLRRAAPHGGGRAGAAGLLRGGAGRSPVRCHDRRRAAAGRARGRPGGPARRPLCGRSGQSVRGCAPVAGGEPQAGPHRRRLGRARRRQAGAVRREGRARPGHDRARSARPGDCGAGRPCRVGPRPAARARAGRRRADRRAPRPKASCSSTASSRGTASSCCGRRLPRCPRDTRSNAPRAACDRSLAPVSTAGRSPVRSSRASRRAESTCSSTPPTAAACTPTWGCTAACACGRPARAAGGTCFAPPPATS